jgi:hypothetical protein
MRKRQQMDVARCFLTGLVQQRPDLAETVAWLHTQPDGGERHNRTLQQRFTRPAECFNASANDQPAD